jgi:hypothetical protein
VSVQGAKPQMSQAEIKAALDRSQHVVQSWATLHEALKSMTDTAWIFRGVGSPGYYPVPSVGREAVYGTYNASEEKRLFQEFKYRAISVLRAPEFDDWGWLAYAQHLGVPTRLLDWTTSPLVALFFALEGDQETDRLIYCAKYSRFVYEVERRRVTPFECKTEGRFTPPLLFERLRAQRGVFTIHHQPTGIFYRKGMRVIRIPHNCVARFRLRLFKYGFDYWYIYPDAEGLGQQLRWHYKSKIGLGIRSILKELGTRSQ